MVKLVQASTIRLEAVRGPNLLKGLEVATRNCYKSENHIKEGSAEKLLKETIFPRKHFSVLEHGVVTLKVSPEIYHQFLDIEPELNKSDVDSEEYPTCTLGRVFFAHSNLSTGCLITGNVRSFNRLYSEYSDIEGVLLIQTFLAETYPVVFPINPVHKRVYSSSDVREIDLGRPCSTLLEAEELIHRFESVRFIIDRGISHELVRHRFFVSFSQESTRYVKYADELCCIDPRPAYKYDKLTNGMTQAEQEILFNAWFTSMKLAEEQYSHMLNLKTSPQMARSVLPNGVKTDVIVTTNLWMWQDIFRQRCAPSAHPQMLEIMIDLRNSFKNSYSFL